MLHLILLMAALGLAAVDPIGIAVMPVILTQRHPIVRSVIFLGGSFISIMFMGMLFALGFGLRLLAIERAYTWLLPSSEIIAAVLLMVTAIVMFWQMRVRHNADGQPPKKLLAYLQLTVWHLCVAGAVLVALQSLVDVVFVIAMIRLGQLHESLWGLLGAISVYAVAALALQLAIIGLYFVTPARLRAKVLDRLRTGIRCYAVQATIIMSVCLSFLLGLNGWLTLVGGPHI